MTTEYFEGPVPGLESKYAYGGFLKNLELVFKLHREIAPVGTYNKNILLITENSGSYLIPVSFTNTP